MIDLGNHSAEIAAVPIELRKKFLGGREINMYLRSRAYPALLVFGKKAFHCDLCGGKPRCVNVRTPGAIQIIK